MKYASAAEITSDDREERALRLSGHDRFRADCSGVAALAHLKVTEAPRYFKGFVTMTVLWAFLIVIVFIVRRLQKRDLAQKVVRLGRV